MAKPINQQMRYAISKSISFGQSKRINKLNQKDKNNNVHKIYSHNLYKSMIDVSKEFGKYIEKNYPKCKFVVDIESRMAHEFLLYKSKNVKGTTITRIYSNLKKLVFC